MHDNNYDEIDKMAKLKKLHDSLSSSNHGEGGIRTRCVSCRKDFMSTGMSKICPQCKFDEDVRYKEIRDYLFDNPGTHSDVICEKFGVSRSAIKRYLQDYKLEISDKELGHFLVCKRCHSPISTGQLCARCDALTNKTTISNFDTGDGTKFRSKG